jgi:hypothetical protein
MWSIAVNVPLWFRCPTITFTGIMYNITGLVVATKTENYGNLLSKCCVPRMWVNGRFATRDFLERIANNGVDGRAGRSDNAGLWVGEDQTMSEEGGINRLWTLTFR